MLHPARSNARKSATNNFRFSSPRKPDLFKTPRIFSRYRATTSVVVIILFDINTPPLHHQNFQIAKIPPGGCIVGIETGTAPGCPPPWGSVENPGKSTVRILYTSRTLITLDLLTFINICLYFLLTRRERKLTIHLRQQPHDLLCRCLA